MSTASITPASAPSTAPAAPPAEASRAELEALGRMVPVLDGWADVTPWELPELERAHHALVRLQVLCAAGSVEDARLLWWVFVRQASVSELAERFAPELEAHWCRMKARSAAPIARELWARDRILLALRGYETAAPSR